MSYDKEKKYIHGRLRELLEIIAGVHENPDEDAWAQIHARYDIWKDADCPVLTEDAKDKIDDECDECDDKDTKIDELEEDISECKIELANSEAIVKSVEEATERCDYCFENCDNCKLVSIRKAKNMANLSEEAELRIKALDWEKKTLSAKISFYYKEIGEQAVILIEKQEVCIEDSLRDLALKVLEMEKRLGKLEDIKL